MVDIEDKIRRNKKKDKQMEKSKRNGQFSSKHIRISQTQKQSK